MHTNDKKGLIWIREITPYPSQRIEGGEVWEWVMARGEKKPIGAIICRKSERHRYACTDSKAQIAWYYLPSRISEETSEKGQTLHGVYNSIERLYRDRYDVRVPDWRVIASGDDCKIEGEVLQWCDLLTMWEDGDLWSDLSFLDDVINFCDSAQSQTREWFGGGPGLSGVWYKVLTINAKALMQEIELRMEEIPAILSVVRAAKAAAVAKESARREAVNARRRQRRLEEKPEIDC